MTSSSVSGLVAAAVAVCAGLYWGFGKPADQRKLDSTSSVKVAPKSVESQSSGVAKTSGSPVSFGFKLAWVAMHTTDATAVAQALQLKGLQRCSWQQGVDGAYEQSVFVTPSIGGWTLVVGRPLPFLDGEASVQAAEALVSQLSRQFGEAQYFSSHRIIEAHGWIRGLHGQIVRAYAHVGEQGETVVATGKSSAAEPATLVNTRSLAAQRDTAYLERPELTSPSEELVMQIAAQWSVDPTSLDTRHDIAPELGWQGNYISK